MWSWEVETLASFPLSSFHFHSVLCSSCSFLFHSSLSLFYFLLLLSHFLHFLPFWYRNLAFPSVLPHSLFSHTFTWVVQTHKCVNKEKLPASYRLFLKNILMEHRITYTLTKLHSLSPSLFPSFPKKERSLWQKERKEEESNSRWHLIYFS